MTRMSEPDPLDQYHNMRRKGAVPPLGTMGAFYRALTTAERKRLLTQIRPSDRVLTDTMIRVFKAALR
jgi:hypothetical protein